MPCSIMFWPRGRLPDMTLLSAGNSRAGGGGIKNCSNANHTAECSSMRTARPAARPPHPFFELRADPFDMLAPCLIFLDRDGPADPLVARERGYIFPSRECPQVGCERLSEISRKVMYDSSGDSDGGHRVISQAEGSSIRYEGTIRNSGLAGYLTRLAR